MLDQLIIHSLKGAAWVAENFPDDPRLGRRLLAAGGALIGLHVYLSHPPWRDSTVLLQNLCLVAGIICGILGLFVFFRRAVWRRQEKAGSGLTSLDLSERNNSAAARVSKEEVGE